MAYAATAVVTLLNLGLSEAQQTTYEKLTTYLSMMLTLITGLATILLVFPLTD